MCYHISFDLKRKKEEARIAGNTFIIDFDSERVNGFANENYPVVANNKPSEIQLFQWGFIPAWCTSASEAEKLQKITLNAVSETLYDRPSYREAAKTNRCLIPVTGFFEWQHQGKTKIPFHISMIDSSIFCLAGIWDRWINQQTGGITYSFTILTTTANDLMSSIHNTKKRMPVIVLADDQEKWIDPQLEESDFLSIIKAIPSHLMMAERLVSS